MRKTYMKKILIKRLNNKRMIEELLPTLCFYEKMSNQETRPPMVRSNKIAGRKVYEVWDYFDPTGCSYLRENEQGDKVGHE